MTPIPQPPAVPLVGNIFNVDPDNTWGSLNALAKKYGPIFKICVLGHQIVFVGNAALAAEICDEKRFRKCVAGPIVEIRRAVHDSLFTAYAHEESWGIAHRIMTPQVTPDAVQRVFSGMTETMGDLVGKWTAKPGQRVDLSNDLDRLNHAANMLCFFDQRLHCVEGPEPALIGAMADATFEAMKRPTRPAFLNWLHQDTFHKNIRTMRDYGARIVDHRKANPSGKKDMLDTLMHGTDPETGKSLTDSQVLDEIINIFIGSATAPNLVSFALYYLMFNRDEISRAREEIDAVVGGAGDGFEHRHLAQLPYCEAILREALRLSATAPGFNIEPVPGSPDPVVLGGEYEIPSKQPIIAVLSSVNRDPEVFDEPEAFRPARMVGDKYEQLPAAVKKGFGNGKRACFGTNYAWEWSFLTLVGILKDVDFELADKSYEVDLGGKNFNGAFSVKPLDFFGLVGPRKR